MKQYMVKIRERKQERFRFPVALHLIQAVGALTLHTGVGTISYIARAMDIKMPAAKLFGEPSSPVSNVTHCKCMFCFGMAKEKRKLF